MRFILPLLICWMGLAEVALAAKAIIRRGFIPGDVPQLNCTVQIDFTSAGGGPNLDTFEAVRDYVIETLDVDEADAWGWGREGEFSLCLTVYDGVAARRILADVTSKVGAKATGSTGLVSVRKGARWLD